MEIWIDPINNGSKIKSPGTEVSSSHTVYNAKGQTKSSTRTVDGVSTTTSYEYDNLGRQTATIGPAVAITGLELSAPAGATAVHLRSETVYNSPGQVEIERTNLHQYDTANSQNPVIDDVHAQETSYTYDVQGRVISTGFDDGTTIRTTYNDEGQVEKETNQLGEFRSFTYDEQGRVATVTLPQIPDPNAGNTLTSPVYSYQYDTFGNLVDITDPLGRDTGFRFSERGQQLSRTLPRGFGEDGQSGTADDPTPPGTPAATWGFTEENRYDDFGRQILHISFEGVVTEFIYDDDPSAALSVPDTGRLYQKNFYVDEAAHDAGVISETVSMMYDAFGREVSTVWDRLVSVPGTVVDTWTNTYNDLGQLARVTSPTGELNYEYDSQGRQTRVTTRGPNLVPVNSGDVSTDIRYNYDSLGRLASVETWERNDVAVDTDAGTAGNQPETESYVYDVVGNLDREVNPDGSMIDYTYDNLNRLTGIVETRANGTTLSEYAYALRADGKRRFAEEEIHANDGSLGSHTTFDWKYDAAGRLTDEIFTSVDDLLFDIDDYKTSFEYDLAGNRVSRRTITDDDGTTGFDATTDTDEVITYSSDANDRMQTETRVIDDGAADVTTYGYDHTQQTSKIVADSSVTSVVNYQYDLQGRMSHVETHQGDGNTSPVSIIDYRYGTDDIRISATEQTDAAADGTVDSIEKTEYLIDTRNHTGYQQVLEETVYDVDVNTGAKTETKKIVYTIGHDQISQTKFTPSPGGEGWSEGDTLVFHYDGHGSTRILTDLAGAIATFAAPQIFHYTSYGQAINFTMSSVGTQYLYSGEQFDSRIGQQYLRARYYNQANGTFNRLDPFFGNKTDPQSFHKYLYAHGDPGNGVDPTGMFTIAGLMSSMGVSSNLRATNGTAVTGTVAANPFFGGGFLNVILPTPLLGNVWLLGGITGTALIKTAIFRSVILLGINHLAEGVVRTTLEPIVVQLNRLANELRNSSVTALPKRRSRLAKSSTQSVSPMLHGS
ncbi:MAG: hypothetical protein GY903_21390 [Fuerstiella sp.]|nr:hypothetical protein [Fuerstiella sp.]MCP4857046.1 hypothetical protein [Fuerstiella sp.]